MRPITDSKTAAQHLADAISSWENGRASISVLEAGGGSLSHIKFTVPHSITVVDISASQLERNPVAHRKILGDLHDVALGQAEYDAVVCYDVIEHLEDPRRVLLKLFDAVRPGGIVVLAAPNPASLSGMITKYTPHWFHVLALRHLFGSKTAGLPGHHPFRTVHHKDIAPARLEIMVRQAGMEIVLFELYESVRRSDLRDHSPAVGRVFDLALSIGNRLVDHALEASDMFMVVRKP